MTPEQRFQEAKAESVKAHKSLAKCFTIAEWNIRLRFAHQKESEAYRDMVVESNSPVNCKFSWEE